MAEEGSPSRTLLVFCGPQFGNVEVFINNAGVALGGSSPMASSPENKLNDWKRTVDVNINGVLNGISSVLESMKEQGHGTIINISSIAGRKAFSGLAVYCGTKFAVHAISEGEKTLLLVAVRDIAISLGNLLMMIVSPC